MLQTLLPSGTTLRASKMDLILKDDATSAFSIIVKDKFGAITVPSVPLTVASSDGTVAVGTLSADGLTLDVSTPGAGKVGTAIVSVTDEAENITASVNVTVVPGVPVTITLEPVVPVVVPPVVAAAEAPAPVA
jgi:hypothetical protein